MASFLDAAPDGRPSRRLLVLVALRAAATSAVLVLAYFLLPMSTRPNALTLVLLVTGLAALAVLVVWQTRAIVRSRRPGVRALQTLTIVITAFLLLFAAGYYLASQARPESFSEPLDRVDALYFAITVFATVGFGDISPVSAGTRIVVAVQMLADLVILGFVLQAVVGAARRGIARAHSEED